ncbi:hypothetical protein BU14_0227s0016 [Porphyra umbilicalis]|uniref:Uncharacterized protein n=1 Tax=Porphyra umbilicalis TaxID=2786 RepID=A0A1X6P495_PORUM|nr:hypothetical protein BU14_0227s0016 [Porphyra umbilicalis]|eukprot:OSX75677.1 hypothetical protein BU14_0227s0016 [Porphyra umbilicalis]
MVSEALVRRHLAPMAEEVVQRHLSWPSIGVDARALVLSDAHVVRQFDDQRPYLLGIHARPPFKHELYRGDARSHVIGSRMAEHGHQRSQVDPHAAQLEHFFPQFKRLSCRRDCRGRAVDDGRLLSPWPPAVRPASRLRLQPCSVLLAHFSLILQPKVKGGGARGRTGCPVGLGVGVGGRSVAGGGGSGGSGGSRARGSDRGGQWVAEKERADELFHRSVAFVALVPRTGVVDDCGGSGGRAGLGIRSRFRVRFRVQVRHGARDPRRRQAPPRTGRRQAPPRIGRGFQALALPRRCRTTLSSPFARRAQRAARSPSACCVPWQRPAPHTLEVGGRSVRHGARRLDEAVDRVEHGLGRALEHEGVLVHRDPVHLVLLVVPRQVEMPAHVATVRRPPVERLQQLYEALYECGRDGVAAGGPRVQLRREALGQSGNGRVGQRECSRFRQRRQLEGDRGGGGCLATAAEVGQAQGGVVGKRR